ncbi:MAG: F0F1 ATP synthase subunit B [Rhizobiales bacterium]|nr:F0F1 ATP synthase subunit B [Hyphomicrobiales bacterium]
MAQQTTSTEHVPASGHGRSFPPFDATTFASQLFWLAIAFVVLYLLMSRLALPRVSAIIAARQGRIAGDLAEAEKLKGKTEAALAAYEKTLAEARADAQSIAGQTRDRLMAQSDKSRKALEAKLNEKLVQAEKTIAATKSAAMANVRGIATDAATAIVQQLIGAAPGDKAVAHAVSEALKS